ncbi:MAG TPA: gliding motility protein GldM [Chitinophagaceae bacterium]|jgi:gliding motility-associated protein GldM|nr:gliding motility protein GldM [Chitinophagaceae bacterium]HRG91788.1 gliding motility protein GldM [Chitinophagaceae bacterium]
MSLPKEPRQKMINIMYLVLTALLALNVSSEILNAFKTVNRSLENTNTTVNASTQQILKSLDQKRTEPQTMERATKWFPKAQQAADISKKLFDYIEGLKGRIITLAGGAPGTDKAFKEDNLDIVTKMMVKEQEGKKLKSMLEQYSKDIKAIDPELDSAFKNETFVDFTNPPGRDGKTKEWDYAYFHMVPTVAGLTILSKFQNDIKTAENKIVAECHKKVGEVKVIFDSYSAIVGQSSKYLMPGQELEITAGVGAYSKTAAPSISINGSGVSLGPDGFASYKTQAGGVGNHSIPVRIAYFNQVTGQQESKEVNIEYTVGSPSGASVALEEMNVLYIGWNNKIRVAAGTGDEKIQVSIAGGGGSLQKTGPGSYIATVTSPTNDCKINVTADGKTSSFNYRVRNIPDPVATVGGVASNENMAAGQFRNQPGVSAYIKDFPLDIKYSVTSFTITMDDENGDIKEASCQGNTWCPAALNIVRSAAPGRMVTIDNIRAVGPDGKNRKIPGLVYYIK